MAHVGLPCIARGFTARCGRSAGAATLAAVALLAFAPLPAHAQPAGSASDRVGWAESDPENRAEAGQQDSASKGTGLGGTEDPLSASDAAGWGDAADEVSSAASHEERADPVQLHVGASLRSDVAFWAKRLDEQALAKARQTAAMDASYQQHAFRLKLGVQAEYDLAYAVQPECCDEATRGSYQWLVRSRESFVAYHTRYWEAAFGAQVLRFGDSDMLSVLDVVNPEDTREPGYGTPAEVILPVLMSRLTLNYERLQVDLAVVHEAYYELRPAPLSPYSVVRGVLVREGFLSSDLRPDGFGDVRYRHSPDRLSAGAQQGFARVLYRGAFEAGLYAAALLDETGILEAPNDVFAAEVDVPVDHPGYTLFGASLALPYEDWLFHSQLALDVQRPVQLADFSQGRLELGRERHTLLRWLLGARYLGMENTVWSLEYAHGTNPQTDEPKLVPVNPWTAAMRVETNWLQQRLGFELIGLAVGPQLVAGWAVRAQATYKISDELSASLGYIEYWSGRHLSPLTGFHDLDRLYARLRWDFSLD